MRPRAVPGGSEAAWRGADRRHPRPGQRQESSGDAGTRQRVMGPNPKRNPVSTRTGRLCRRTSTHRWPRPRGCPRGLCVSAAGTARRTVQTDQTGGVQSRGRDAFGRRPLEALQTLVAQHPRDGAVSPGHRPQMSSPHAFSQHGQGPRSHPPAPAPRRSPCSQHGLQVQRPRPLPRRRRLQDERRVLLAGTKPGRRGCSPLTAGRRQPALEAASKATDNARAARPTRVHGQRATRPPCGLAAGDGCDELTPKSPENAGWHCQVLELCVGDTLSQSRTGGQSTGPQAAPPGRPAARSALPGLSWREHDRHSRGL